MPFGISVGDTIATIQLANLLAKALIINKEDIPSTVFSSAIHELKLLTRNLSTISDTLTSVETGKVLAQEEFQELLRVGLANIRRDFLTFERFLERGSQTTNARYHVRIKFRYLVGIRLANLRDQVYKENAKLHLLLVLCASDIVEQDTSTRREVFLSLKTLSEVNSEVEDFNIRLWLAGPEQDVSRFSGSLQLSWGFSGGAIPGA